MRLYRDVSKRGFTELFLTFPEIRRLGDIQIISFSTELRFKFTKTSKLFCLSVLGFGLTFESYRKVR